MMRITGETESAQELQIVELLPHALHGLGSFVAVREELAYYQRVTVALFVEIDFAVFHAEDAKVRPAVAEAHFWQDVMHQIGVQRVARGKMSNVLFWHSLSLKPRGCSPTESA